MSRFLKYIGLTEDVSMWLLVHTASRTWTRCCNAEAGRVEVGVGSLVAWSRTGVVTKI